MALFVVSICQYLSYHSVSLSLNVFVSDIALFLLLCSDSEQLSKYSVHNVFM